MKKQPLTLTLSSYQKSLPTMVRHIINDKYPEIVALAQYGYHNGGRGAITIIEDGSVAYFLARELAMFLGIKGRVIQSVVGCYKPEHEIVVCILAVDRPPYCLVLQQDAPAPLETAQHILPGQLPITPSA